MPGAMAAKHDTISNWLTAIPSTFPSDIEAPSAVHDRKRRRLLTPDMSEDDLERYSTPVKKRRPDPEATPRNKQAPTPAPLDDGTARLKRSRSGRSSPTKGLALLRMEHIIDRKSFGERDLLPTSLEHMVQSVRNDAAGVGIFTESDKSRMSSHTQMNSFFESMLDSPHLFDHSGRRAEQGDLPDLDTLINIWEEAQMCEVEGHSEAMWNCSVHYPLLYTALRGAKINQPSTQSEIQIKPMNITTASITRPYATMTGNTILDWKVDFCLCIKARERSRAHSALWRAAQASTQPSINHTDYTPLMDKPISLSIETKRTGEDWRAALEQISTWMAGHWKKLDELVNANGPAWESETEQDAETQQDVAGTRPEATGDAPGSGKRSRPEFLPGVIIQGHDWHFIAATRGRLIPNEADLGRGSCRETVIWSKILIGSTDNMQGFCQIVSFLQRMAKWSAEVYWPWCLQIVQGD
ncbi:unnamed protein product [Clonostachys rosea]|uniref:PD-(D/E)XK nuclease-like domain-containing protein n=1 Tax=Bionectria ochroleuca TaxID=29856 RepID=A0ABY6UNC3_BIOOC|nr:unnamed protein product [Clonostachys rosea]